MAFEFKLNEHNVISKVRRKKNHFDVITISVTITWVIEADVILQ